MSSAGLNIGVVIVGGPELRARVEEEVGARDDQLVIGSVEADQGVVTATGRVPDVVVITEPAGPGPSASEIARAIGAALPATRILLVTSGAPAPDPETLIDAWIAGAIDLDTATPGTVADAVEQIYHGEAVVDPGLAAAVLARHRQGASSVPLTATEEEVLTRLAAGDTVDTLATDYAVTPRLVRLHLGGALARLHPSS